MQGKKSIEERIAEMDGGPGPKMNVFVSKPPQIHHIGQRPDDWVQMIEDAAKNIHVRKETLRLLLFYAKNISGFRPALSLIEETTGIHANKISEIRKRLVKKGLIAYTGDAIFIDWERIGIYAGLLKPLRLPQSGKYRFKPARITPKNKKQAGDTVQKEERIINGKKTEMSAKELLYLYLETLNEDEYAALIKAFEQCDEIDNSILAAV